MGFFTNKIERNEIEIGDHIYSYRAAFTYSHHGIYVGGDNVVHFTVDSNKSRGSSSFPSSSFSSSSSSSSSSSFSSSISSSSSMSKTPIRCMAYPHCGFRQPGSGVVLSCLDCFLQNGSLYRFEYGVTWYKLCAKIRGGSCTTAMSDDPHTVIHRAIYLLHNGFGDYDLFQNNSEDFVLHCKTGLLEVGKSGSGTSGQILSAFGAPPTAAIAMSCLKYFLPTPVVAPLTVCTYAYKRYSSDIGVRSDVRKVDVEN